MQEQQAGVHFQAVISDEVPPELQGMEEPGQAAQREPNVDPSRIADILSSHISLSNQDNQIEKLYTFSKPKPLDGTEGNTLTSQYKSDGEPSEQE